MTDLIEKLESATEGSRELDAQIATVLGFKVSWAGKAKHILMYWCPLGQPAARRVPRWTTSLDTALTLVPEEWHITISGQNDTWAGRLEHMRKPEQIGLAATPALALCIAALKAQEKA